MGLTLKGARRRAGYRRKPLGGFKVASLSPVHLQSLHQTAIVSNCQRNIKMSTSEGGKNASVLLQLSQSAQQHRLPNTMFRLSASL